MIESVKAFDINGHYIFKGERGVQSGEVLLYQDNKVIGNIGDNNIGKGVLSPKLLVGLYSPEQDRVSFFKLARLNFSLAPIVWTLQGNGTPELSGEYTGGWAASRISLPNEIKRLEEILLKNASSAKKKPLTIDLEVETLKRIFNQEHIRAIEDCAEFFNSTGALTFTERRDTNIAI